MTRESIYEECIHILKNNSGILIEAATGTGKTSIALQITNYLFHTSFQKVDYIPSILILVAKKVHKQTWKDEIAKWCGADFAATVQTECYESLKKHVGKSYDVIILDECHHVQSELRQELLNRISFKYMIGLSATIPKKLKYYLMSTYNLGLVQCSLQDAIEDGVLPEPEIMLLPLQLQNYAKSETIEINPKKPGEIYYDEYERLWAHKKNHHAILRCTPKQKLQYMDNKIVFAKRAFEIQRTESVKRRWLRLCGDRLKFLAECKNDLVKELLSKISDKRVLTFCTSIEQTEVLGKNCIHSKNKNANAILDKFNKGKLNHITACQVLNEGVNLKNCQFGVFANINASSIIKVQRVGRILRHEHPVVIIPYYVGSREEEIVKEWIGEYNEKLIHKYNTLKDLTNAIINR